MKLKPSNILIVVLILLTIVIAIQFGTFDFVENNYHSETQGLNQDLGGSGDISSFSFTPIRSQISGLEVYFYRDFLIDGEGERNIKLAIDYMSLVTGQPNQFQELIKINTIRKGLNEIRFFPLSVDKSNPVTVKFEAESNLASKGGLGLLNRDMNPDPFINTSPRIIYHEEVNNLLKESFTRIKADSRFVADYETLLLVLIGLMTFLFIFVPDCKDEK